jgi:hypothetical protein
MKPVLSIALTQLNIYRPDVVAPAVHVTCGDGTGGLLMFPFIKEMQALHACNHMFHIVCRKLLQGYQSLMQQHYQHMH